LKEYKLDVVAVHHDGNVEGLCTDWIQLIVLLVLIVRGISKCHFYVRE